MAPATAAGGERPRPATPTDVSAAIEQRRRAERRRRHLTLGAGIACLLAALLVVWLVRFSPVFAARQVEVVGNQRVGTEQVLDVADVPLGDPLATLDAHAVAQRVADELVAVEKVQLDTSLPSTVRIRITERSAVYQRKVGNQWQLVDAAGVVFVTQPKAVKGLVPVITPSVENRLLADVASVVAALPEPLRAQVVRVDATGPDRIVLQLKDSRQVMWGGAAASAQKSAVLQVLLTREAKVYDVSSPGTPTTR